MMMWMIAIVNAVLPALYGMLVWTYGKAFFSDAAWAKSSKSILLYTVLSVHVFSIAVRTIAFEHPPVTTIFEIFSMLAFSLAAIYAIIELRSNQKETGYFVLNIAFFFQLISSLFIRDSVVVPEVLRSNLFGLHVSTALLGYSAITVSAAYAFLYLMLYHEIKKTRFGPIYRKLPNLAALERMSSIALGLAFVLLGIAIVAGFVWLPRAFTDFSYADPKLVGTMMLWVFYGVALLAQRFGNWKGRKLMLLSISGFAVSLFSLTVINVFFSKFHRFF